MRSVCCENDCTGCGACVSVCPQKAVILKDNIEYMIAEIDEDLCIRCKACYNVCQQNNPLVLSEPTCWYQGWAKSSIRQNGSSGGLATSIMMSFVGEKSYVCSCIFDQGEFNYVITNKMSEIGKFSGSKYVKSKPNSVYKKILNYLKDNNRVLMIGLPCHIGALKKYINGLYSDRLYTIDLICHGTPSPELLKSYINEKRIQYNQIKNIKFREKNTFGLIVDDKPVVMPGTIDRYTLGFLKGLFYTKNCYSCQYAQTNRVGDLTLGDSWGTKLIDEEKKGVSLVLCQNNKGKELIKTSDLYLHDVDLIEAKKSNHQLNTPTLERNERKSFFINYYKTNSFSQAVFRCYKKNCIKQVIKGILIKFIPNVLSTNKHQ